MLWSMNAGGVSLLTPLLSLVLVGCSQPESGAGGAASGSSQSQVAPAAAGGGAGPSPEALAEAQQIFANRCTPCHGAAGGGDGAASAGLNPKPRDLRDPAWQGAVTDEHIEKIIQYGGAAVGKSPAMPSNPDLSSRSEIVAALRMHIRSLKQ